MAGTYQPYNASEYPYISVTTGDTPNFDVFDRFTTVRAAGSVNGTSADVIGGTRTVVDTNTKISVTGGNLDFATGAAANSGVWWPVQTRALGKTFMTSATRATTTPVLTAGWDNDQTGGITNGIRLSSTNLQAVFGGTAITVGTSTSGSYSMALVMRATGFFYFIKGNEYTYWTLIWTGSTTTTAGYPAVGVGNTTSPAVFDWVRVPISTFVPVPLQSDGMSATTTDGAGNAEANGPTGTAYTNVGTWGVSGGARSCSALSGGLGFSYLEAGNRNVVIDAAVTRSGGNAGIVARYQDASNYIIAYHDGTNAKLDKIVAGVTTNLVSAAATYSAGATLRLVLEGTDGRLFYNNAAVGSLATVPAAGTQHGLYTTSTGNTFDNLVIWGRGTSGEYAELDTLGTSDSIRYYGNGISTNPNTLWLVSVDWDNVGDYLVNEAQYTIGMTIERGWPARWRLNGEGDPIGLEMPMVGKAQIILDNTSGRYTNTNVSSPLYGLIAPEKYIKIKAQTGGYEQAMFHGIIKRIKVENGENKRVILDCEDGMRILYNSDTNISIQTNVDHGDAIDAILDDISWPTRFGRAIGTFDLSSYGGGMYHGVTTSFTIPYWWAEGKAINEIQKLVDADGGRLFVNGFGEIAYIRSRANSTPLQMLRINPSFTDFTTYTPTEENTLKNLNLPQNLEMIRTALKQTINPLTLYETVDVWQLVDVPMLEAGETANFWGTFSYNAIECRAMNVITPVSTTDYTANAAADGTGADMTADISVSITVLGNRVKYTITNNHATDDTYITLAKVRADALVPEYSFEYIDSNDTYGLVTQYGLKYVTINSPFQQTYEKAVQAYNATYYKLLNFGESAWFQMQGRNTPQLAFDIGVTTVIDFDTLNYTDGAYLPLFAESNGIFTYVKHQWLIPNGQDVLSTFIFEHILDTTN